jgi:hypothetical protein
MQKYEDKGSCSSTPTLDALPKGRRKKGWSELAVLESAVAISRERVELPELPDHMLSGSKSEDIDTRYHGGGTSGMKSMLLSVKLADGILQKRKALFPQIERRHH